MLFLVEVEITKSKYMDSTRTSRMTHRLVRADNEYAAEEKVVKHIESKSEPYGLTYSADVMEVSECIE
jgi:hypothetical protein